MAEHDLGLLIAVLDALPRLSVTRAQGAARIPAIAIVGSADPLLDHSRRIAAWWPAVRLVELPGADHLTVLDRPELLAQIRILIGQSNAAASRR
ncbi:MAG: alpha/beta fold hydrolase, partial [Gammaproteobacteria bacterium]